MTTWLGLLIPLAVTIVLETVALLLLFGRGPAMPLYEFVRVPAAMRRVMAGLCSVIGAVVLVGVIGAGLGWWPSR